MRDSKGTSDQWDLVTGLELDIENMDEEYGVKDTQVYLENKMLSTKLEEQENINLRNKRELALQNKSVELLIKKINDTITSCGEGLGSHKDSIGTENDVDINFAGRQGAKNIFFNKSWDKDDHLKSKRLNNFKENYDILQEKVTELIEINKHLKDKLREKERLKSNRPKSKNR